MSLILVEVIYIHANNDFKNTFITTHILYESRNMYYQFKQSDEISYRLI